MFINFIKSLELDWLEHLFDKGKVVGSSPTRLKDMPQLCLETFVTQYYWFIAIFLLVYWFNTAKQLPKLSETLFVRDMLISTKSTNKAINDNMGETLQINIIPVGQKN